MVEGHTSPKTEVAAARLAIEWQYLFAAELRQAAKEAARGSHVITVDHYHKAFPVAVSSIVDAITGQLSETADEHRKIA